MTTITYKGFLIVKSKNLRLKYSNGDRKIFDNLNIEINDRKVLYSAHQGRVKAHYLMY